MYIQDAEGETPADMTKTVMLKELAHRPPALRSSQKTLSGTKRQRGFEHVKN